MPSALRIGSKQNTVSMLFDLDPTSDLSSRPTPVGSTGALIRAWNMDLRSPALDQAEKSSRLSQIFWLERQICAIAELSRKENVGWPLRSDGDDMNGGRERGKDRERTERRETNVGLDFQMK
ncbi:hypothetical protein SLEP1_g7204 [Rubroshorea leprosula]|uniref:Uncharacterized protein n=1 Tax=Rubroshorea leprosula TaxID=152421 RepID=A0AAV5I3X3_9ROSI|nr:hypothetical protein SLEP1_g7204 [Rubroshorea leprosula]